jgi:folylpolyglutamate synthase/dihydropteroate synthase
LHVASFLGAGGAAADASEATRWQRSLRVLWRALGGGGEARVCVSVEEALSAARAFAAADAGGDTHALVTGSLYVVGEALAASGAGADDDGGNV